MQLSSLTLRHVRCAGAKRASHTGAFPPLYAESTAQQAGQAALSPGLLPTFEARRACHSTSGVLSEHERPHPAAEMHVHDEFDCTLHDQHCADPSPHPLLSPVRAPGGFGGAGGFRSNAGDSSSPEMGLDMHAHHESVRRPEESVCMALPTHQALILHRVFQVRPQHHVKMMH